MQRRMTGLGVLAAMLALAVALLLSAPADAKRPPRPTPTPTPTPSPSTEPTPTPDPTPTSEPAPTPTQAAVSIFGAWHCSADYCTWGRVRDASPGGEFDENNHWLIDGNPDPALAGQPSVNLVILSFVNPLDLQQRSTVQYPLRGIPVGMTQGIVDYFTHAGIRVMLSIGGITYVDDWNAALALGGHDLGLKAAAVATELGVGIEIDYEENTDPNIDGLQQFIEAYRSAHPYDASGTNPAARLTIDLAAGDRWLIALTQHATAYWLQTDNPVLDYANAMVPARQPSVDKAIANWQEHVDGKPQYAPPIPPLAPAKFTGGLYVAEGSQVRAECTNFAASLQKATESFVRNIQPNGAGTTNGMLGWMFWAAEKPSTRGVGTQPPNTCEGGMGVAATEFNIEPMRALRQE